MMTSLKFHLPAILRGIAACAACAASMVVLPVLAQENINRQSEAYQAGMTQGDVRREAAVIEARMMDLRNQMLQLMPDDVATVEQAIKKLATLSAGDMAAAIKALEEASRSTNEKEQLGKISAAMQNQGAASTALRKLAVDLRMRETIAGIDSALTVLVRRQVASNSEILTLHDIKPLPKDLNGNDANRWQIALESEKGLSSDLKLLERRIETLAQDMADDSKNGLVRVAQVAKSKDLSGLTDKVTSLVQSGPFSDASTAQMEVVAVLVAMEEALAGNQDPLERLRKFADRLQVAIGDQKSVVDAVMLIGEKQDLDRSFKQTQGNLRDEVRCLQYEIRSVSNPVSDLLVLASDASIKAIRNFRRMWEEHMDARVNTQESLKQINAAYQLIKQQIVKAEAQAPQNAAQLAAKLDQLERAVSAASKQQALAAQQPVQEPALLQAKADRVNDFQQRALPLAPEAAAALGEAANELPKSTPEAQQAAAEKLADAAKDLAEQKEQAEKIATAQEQIAKAQEQTAQAQQKLEKGDTAAAEKELSQAQESAEAAQKTAQEAAPDAAKEAQEAGKELAEAKKEAGQKQAESAQQNADQAAAALAEAAKGLAQAAGQLPGMGDPAAPTPGKGEMAGQTPGKGEAPGQTPGTGQTPGGLSPQPSEKGLPGKDGNGGGGGSGDNLVGSGDIRGPVEDLHGLNPKDRSAVLQLQSEKPPHEFVSEVEQYYKNIADGGGP